MLRYLILEILLPLIVFALLRSIIRGLFQAGRTAANVARSATQPPPQSTGPTVIPGGELRKDPVCGTYVSTSASLSRTVNGETFFFCSPECRDRYRG
jgi:YHS domain-containing protein